MGGSGEKTPTSVLFPGGGGRVNFMAIYAQTIPPFDRLGSESGSLLRPQRERFLHTGDHPLLDPPYRFGGPPDNPAQGSFRGPEMAIFVAFLLTDGSMVSWVGFGVCCTKQRCASYIVSFHHKFLQLYVVAISNQGFWRPLLVFGSHSRQQAPAWRRAVRTVNRWPLGHTTMAVNTLPPHRNARFMAAQSKLFVLRIQIRIFRGARVPTNLWWAAPRV